MVHGQNTKVVPITVPVAIVDNTSWTSLSIDTKGWAYLEIYVMFGAMDIAMAALKLQMSDTDGSYADVSGGDFSVSPATLPSATDDGLIVKINVDLRGKKRYFDLVATGGDGTAGTYMAAWAILSRGEEAPNSASERGVSQELFC